MGRKKRLLSAQGNLTRYGSSLAVNGGFDSDTDGWTPENASLSSISGGASGNCMLVTNSASAQGKVSQEVSVIPNKQVRFSFYQKNGSTGASVIVRSEAGGGLQFYASGTITNVSWTKYEVVFVPTSSSVFIEIFLASATLGRTTVIDTVIVQQFSTFWKSPGVGSLMLTFDDALDGTYSAFQYASALGLKGTIYVITSKIDTTGYMTTAQLQEVYNAGWALGNHTRDHMQLDLLAEALQEAQLAGGKADLDAAGWTAASVHVAYPNGAYNADTLTAMAATGMLTGRIVGDAYVTPATVNPYLIPVDYGTIVTATPVDTIKNEVSIGDLAGLYTLLLFHDLAEVPAASEWALSNFRTLCDWIASSGIATKTIVDLYNALP